MLMNLRRAMQKAEALFAARVDVKKLSITQFYVLNATTGAAEFNQSDIVEMTGVDRSTVADVLRRLEERGLVKRERGKKDNRSVFVKRTAAGRKLVDKYAKDYEAVATIILAAIPANFHVRTVGWLDKIAAIEAPKPAPAPALPEMVE